MKYLSINTVLQSFEGCRNKTQNKFWGMVCIIKAIGERIIPATKYSFSVEKVQTYLEELFRLEDVKKTYSTSNMWSVVFSTYWIDFVPEQMFSSKPNIYDVAAWFYRRTAFEDETTPEQIVGGFMDLLNISKEDSEKWFSFQAVSYSFETQLYSDSNLMDSILKKLSLSNSSNKTLSFEDQTFIKSNPGSLGQAPFVQTLYANQGLQKCLILTQFDFQDFYPMTNNIKTIPTHNITTDLPLQQIFYGAPGTGKSHRIKEIIRENGIDEKEQVIRTTFHPDSDYSTFVGCYKPIMKSVPQTYVVEGNEKPVMADKDNQATKDEIVYDYTPQAFVQAYTKAWTTNKPVILVIEEINRGNCAQIFGDIFQLLDRGDDGVSEYEIKPDKALENYLKDYFAAFEYLDEQIKSGKIMKLPSNLYIWATMNTSDQSLFPIDSAFKRRWEWKYMKIVRPYKKNEDGSFKLNENGEKIPFGFKIEGDHDWWEFLEQINAIIDKMTNSADKQLGYFFAKAKDDMISYDTFVSKVCFYLWNDIFKTYALDEQQGDLFSYKDEEGQKKQLTFPAFYDGDGDVINAVVEAFINNVMNWNNKIDKA